MTAGLEARCRRVDITPIEPLSLFGFADRSGNFQSIESRLEANIVVFSSLTQNIGLVGVDTLFCGPELRVLVLSLLANEQIHLDDVVLVATHTHFAPSLDHTKPKLGITDQRYLKFVASQIVSAISSLLEESPNQVLSAKWGASTCTAAVYRRRKTLGIVRKGIAVFPTIDTFMLPAIHAEHVIDLHCYLAYGQASRPLFCVWTWPCHPVAGHSRNAVSANFPGVVRDSIRRNVGDPSLTCIYLPGFAGDLRPCFVRKRRAIDLVRFPFSTTLFSSTINAQAYVKFCDEICASASNALENLQPLEFSKRLGVARGSVPLTKMLTGMQSGSRYIALCDLTLGPLQVRLAGAEVCSSYYPLQKNYGKPGFMYSGYLEDSIGYWPSDAQRLEGGYESRGFIRMFSLQGKLQANLEQALAEGFARTAATAKEVK